LAPALRASYALPGIFKPVRIAENWFIDGGVVNPIPVSACRALGARMVIAVNLSAESTSGIVLQNPPDITVHSRSSQQPSLASILVAAFNITQDRLSRSRLAGDPPDVSLTLRTPGLSLFDFARAEEAITAGRAAADSAMPEIERMLSRL
jgi:NTE family protein